MTRFAYVFLTDLKDSGLGYIWFNQRPDRVEANKGFIISCTQAAHQQATEKKLLKLVREAGYPDAKIWEDKERELRYIKVR